MSYLVSFCYGSAAVLYNKNLNLKVKNAHGGPRIVAIEVQALIPICICPVYMPSWNSKSISSDKENYQHYLDQLVEILHIYNSTHMVLILGDLNALLVQRKGNLQDAMLKNFVNLSVDKRMWKLSSILTRLINQNYNQLGKNYVEAVRKDTTKYIWPSPCYWNCKHQDPKEEKSIINDNV